jgi:hypothetical protein
MIYFKIFRMGKNKIPVHPLVVDASPFFIFRINLEILLTTCRRVPEVFEVKFNRQLTTHHNNNNNAWRLQ